MLIVDALLVFILIGALIAVESRNLLSAVIAVGTVGLGLCIIFLLLGAPELAITQLVVEILALIILIRATVATNVPETYKGRELLSYSVTLLFIVLFLGTSWLALRLLPSFGFAAERVADSYLELALPKAGVPGVVAAIMFDFRSLDMLGSIAVIFAAVVGALTILRVKGKNS